MYTTILHLNVIWKVRTSIFIKIGYFKALNLINNHNRKVDHQLSSGMWLREDYAYTLFNTIQAY